MRVYVPLAATVLVGLLVGCSSTSKAPQSKDAAIPVTDADEQVLKTDPIERAMEKLLKEYPGSAYELDAHTKIKEGREHLAAYEIYVGKHYYRQAAYLAALHRFERVLALYPDLEDSAEAHYYLAKTYKDIGAPERAVAHLTVLLTLYPKAIIRKDGQALLTSLNGKAASMLATAEVPSPSSKTSLPAPLPPLSPTRSLSMNPADIPPAGANGNGHTIINCGLNILC